MRLSTAIDDDTLFEVVEGDIDHGTLAVTVHGQDARAHIVWWQVNPNSIRHFFFDDTIGARTQTLTGMPGAAAAVISGASGTLWALSNVTGQPTMCQLDPGSAMAGSGNCVGSTFLAGGTGLTPAPTFTLYQFPGAGPMDLQATCPGGTRCFDAEEPFDVVADPRIPNRLFAVYQGVDSTWGSNKASVYFTMHIEGTAFNNWSASVRVNSRSMTDVRHFIDPSITVDHEGTIVVTYSAIKSPSAGEPAAQFVAVSSDGGVTWTETQIEDGWNPSHLPWHCGRNNFFLGEYRDGAVRGGRALHHFHASAGSSQRTVLRSAWASRWFVYHQYP